MNDPHDHMEVGMKATRDAKGGFFKNLTTNIKGPAVSVVIIAWIAAMVVLALWGGENAKSVVGSLAVFMGIYLAGLAARSN